MFFRGTLCHSKQFFGRHASNQKAAQLMLDGFSLIQTIPPAQTEVFFLSNCGRRLSAHSEVGAILS